MWREGLAKGASSTGKDLCRVDLRIRVFLPPESYGFHVVDFTQKKSSTEPICVHVLRSRKTIFTPLKNNCHFFIEA